MVSSWQEIDDAFEQALALEGEARRQFLNALNPGELRTEAGANELFENLIGSAASMLDSPGETLTQAGPWRLERALGQGGILPNVWATCHDRQWAAKMKEIGLQHSMTGEAGGSETGQSVTHYISVGGAYARAYKKLKASGFQLGNQRQRVAHKPTRRTPAKRNSPAPISSRTHGRSQMPRLFAASATTRMKVR